MAKSTDDVFVTIMAGRGIELISYFQVDNVLINIIDPVFIGAHLASASEMSSKGCLKSDPLERVGNFALRDGKLVVVEYCDFPDELSRQRNPDGSLTFALGSIGIHIIDCNFARRLAGDPRSLAFHRAEKSVPIVDIPGSDGEHREQTAVKFETFIFDALPLASHSIVLEVDRTEEFSPIKNARGDDSPASARRHLVEQAARRLEAVGVGVPRGADGVASVKIEISPLFAMDHEELKRKLPRDFKFESDLLLE